MYNNHCYHAFHPSYFLVSYLLVLVGFFSVEENKTHTHPGIFRGKKFLMSYVYTNDIIIIIACIFRFSWAYGIYSSIRKH